jgi:predicted RNA-binding protein with RPS1 domain
VRRAIAMVRATAWVVGTRWPPAMPCMAAWLQGTAQRGQGEGACKWMLHSHSISLEIWPGASWIHAGPMWMEACGVLRAVCCRLAKHDNQRQLSVHHQPYPHCLRCPPPRQSTGGGAAAPKLSARRSSFRVGDVVVGTVLSVRPHRALVELGNGTIGTLADRSISHATGEPVNIESIMRAGDRILAMVIKNPSGHSLKLSTKELEPTPGSDPQLLFAKAEEMADVWRKRGEAAWIRAEIGDCKTTEQLVSLVEQHGQAFDPNHAEAALSRAAKLGAAAMPRGIIEQMLQLAREQLPQMAAADIVRMLNVLATLGPANNKSAFMAALLEAVVPKLHELEPRQLAKIRESPAKLELADGDVVAASRMLEEAAQNAAQEAAQNAAQQRELEQAAQEAHIAANTAALSSYRVGGVVEGVVVGVLPRGAFVRLGDGIVCLLQVSEISYEHVLSSAANAAACGGRHIGDVIRNGDRIRAMVLQVDAERRRLNLSTKALEPSPGDWVCDRQLVFDKAEEMAEAWLARSGVVTRAPTTANFQVRCTPLEGEAEGGPYHNPNS